MLWDENLSCFVKRSLNVFVPIWQIFKSMKMNDYMLQEDMMSSAEVFPIISLDDHSSEIILDPGKAIPILPLRNMVLFPEYFILFL